MYDLHVDGILALPSGALDPERAKGLKQMLGSLEYYLEIPVPSIFHGAFPGLDEQSANDLQRINRIYALCGNIRFVDDHHLHDFHSTDDLPSSISDLLHCGEVLLGQLFDLQNQFWEKYRWRVERWNAIEASIDPMSDLAYLGYQLSRRYGMHFVALDALHSLSPARNSVDYELINQSLKWLITSYALRITGRRNLAAEANKTALRMTELLDLPAYPRFAMDVLAGASTGMGAENSTII